MSYTKVTRKGQLTIPLRFREKYNLREGVKVAFEETPEGLLLKPVPDITGSAGSLSSYADVKDVLSEILKGREEDFH